MRTQHFKKEVVSVIKKFHRIRELKAKYGITDFEMSKVICCSTVSMSNKINGARPFNIEEALRIILFFENKGEQITFKELFFNEVVSNENISA